MFENPLSNPFMVSPASDRKLLAGKPVQWATDQAPDTRYASVNKAPTKAATLLQDAKINFTKTQPKVDINTPWSLEDFVKQNTGVETNLGSFVQKNTWVKTEIAPELTTMNAWRWYIQNEQERVNEAMATTDWSTMGQDNTDTNIDMNTAVADLVTDISENWDITVEDLNTYFPEFIGKEQSIADLAADISENWDITMDEIKQYYPELLQWATMDVSWNKFREVWKGSDEILPYMQTTKFDENATVWDFLKNTGKSAWNMVAGIGNMALNPIDSAKTIAKLAIWWAYNLWENIAQFATWDSEEQIAEGVRDNLGKFGDFFVEAGKQGGQVADYFTERYGTKEGRKQALYQDPVGVLSDVASAVSGWAALAWKTAWLVWASKTASKLWKVADIANQIDPATQVMKWAWYVAGKWADVAKKAGKWVAWLLPSAEEQLTRLNRLTKWQQSKFVNMTWKTVWEWMNERWFVTAGEDTVSKLWEHINKYLDAKDTALSKIKDTFTSEDLVLMWEDAAEFAKNTRNPNASRIQELAEKAKDWLNWSEASELIRFYQKNNKFSYGKIWASPEKAALATNLDSAVREQMLKFADDNWVPWLRDINKEIQATKTIIDQLWANMKWSIGNNYMTLTDWIVAGGTNFDPTAFIASKLTKSDWFQKKYINIVNKVKWHTNIPDKLEILKDLSKASTKNDIDNILSKDYNTTTLDNTNTANDNISNNSIASSSNNNTAWQVNKNQDILSRSISKVKAKKVASDLLGKDKLNKVDPSIYEDKPRDIWSKKKTITTNNPMQPRGLPSKTDNLWNIKDRAINSKDFDTFFDNLSNKELIDITWNDWRGILNRGKVRQYFNEQRPAIVKERPIKQSIVKNSLDKTIKDDNVLRNVNPTWWILVEYNPSKIAKMKLADNITTLDKTMKVSPDKEITIYRWTDYPQKEIVPWDFITTNYDLAKSYSWKWNVIIKKVKVSDILDDIEEPLWEEYIYKPNKTPQKIDKWIKNNTIEDTLSIKDNSMNKLKEEAKKYKSADEFIKSKKETLYHWSPVAWDIEKLSISKEWDYWAWIYLADKIDNAKKFAYPTYESNLEAIWWWKYKDMNTGKIKEFNNAGVIPVKTDKLQLLSIDRDGYESNIASIKSKYPWIDSQDAYNKFNDTLVQMWYDWLNINGTKAYDEPQILVFPSSENKINTHKQLRRIREEANKK